MRQHRQPRLRLKRLFRSKRRKVLQTRPQVADASDCADGVMQSVLLHGRYPDCARSELPLAAEDNFDPEGAEEGLCPAQPTSECAGVLWPARPVADTLLPHIIDVLPRCACGAPLLPRRNGLDKSSPQSRPTVHTAGLLPKWQQCKLQACLLSISENSLPLLWETCDRRVAASF